MTRRVCVIGGGLGGLTAARALVAAGLDAHVREAGPRAGGVVHTSVVDGFVREHAASSFLGNAQRGAYSLCKALDVPMQTASPRAKKRWIYLDRKLRALPQNPMEFVRSDLLTWRGKLDLLREPLRAGRGQSDESIYAFAARRFGAEAARAIVAPFVTGIFAADAHDVSVEAGFPTLAALDHEGGVVRGMIKRHAKMVVDRVRGKRTELERPPRGLFAPAGGVGRLIDALAADLGARVHLNAPVSRIEAVVAGVRVDGETWDACVLALPAEDTIPLLADVPGLVAKLAPMRRAPAAVVYLGFKEGDVPGAVDGFGFLTALGEDLRVLGVVFESVVWPDRAPPGQILLRCIFGGSRDPSANALTDAELIDHATHDVGTVLGASWTPTHTSVIRSPRGIAQYPIGHTDHVRAATAVARTHRMVLAGADYRGPGINDLCADASVIVDEVCAWA